MQYVVPLALLGLAVMPLQPSLPPDRWETQLAAKGAGCRPLGVQMHDTAAAVVVLDAGGHFPIALLKRQADGSADGTMQLQHLDATIRVHVAPGEGARPVDVVLADSGCRVPRPRFAPAVHDPAR